ncbi:Serine/Threonine kinase domain protein (macronuclear) [Tetrahymena thermophila SB210]|uniref:Serine/threonine-protein kinase PLK n=1 Tax=Tetrahymena thermophila (strain SB210) TaxID=312017 RepID=Q229B8_TETTS|nr:Serine/Threonine kinase domain protein [Tetrahymena thermophila SB210]EAR81887.2 Serine/Threonine kinase domain protein [Tetrahymena thermophila SB210]|eukprot:XP_001029550.2 Serine/Threonine kinase domain protein [Tetrahymena thermophila SB210]
MSQQAAQQQPQQKQSEQGQNNNNDQGVANYPTEQKIIEEKTENKVTGEKIIKKYSRGKLLGSGGFAKCYEVIALDTDPKAIFAAKIIPKSTLTKSRQRVKLISEIKIHKSLHHKNIVQFEHVFEDHDNVYILLELCPYQTLNELIKRRKRITEYETQIYVMQIVNALKYLHQNKIIHRDLKLGNLFLGDNMTLKIGDFGLATKIEYEGEKKKTVCGTPNYIAPEILEGKDGHSYEVDMWSLGVIIYTLLIGKPPFETKDVRTTYKRIKMNNYCFPEQIQISDNAKSIITSILNLNPQKRLTLDELLEHPFMQGTALNPENLPISSLVVPFQKPKKEALKEKSNNQIVQDQKIGSGSLASTQSQMNMAATQSGLQLNGTKDLNGNMRSQSNKNLGSNQMDQANLLKMQSMQTLKHGQFNSDLNSENILVNTPPASEIWVTQWVDYSNKYGLGYALNNGTIGVFFNDFTKIVIDPEGQYIEYYEKQPEEKYQKSITFTPDNYPQELKKKVTLLEHFRSYLQGDHGSNNQNANNNYDVNPPSTFLDNQTGKKMLYYVKKWVKTKNAILFRLQNKIVQVSFSDKTEIILNSIMKIVTFNNKQGIRQNYPLTPDLKMYSPEMEKRLKYTKQILTDILKQSQPSQNNINNNPQNNTQRQPMQPSSLSNQNNQNINTNGELLNNSQKQNFVLK